MENASEPTRQTQVLALAGGFAWGLTGVPLGLITAAAGKYLDVHEPLLDVAVVLAVMGPNGLLLAIAPFDDRAKNAKRPRHQLR